MRTEIIHFTEAPELQHFAEVKVSKNDNIYGAVWGNLVREYLKTAYAGPDAQTEIVSDGITYKVLKRGEVTAFYDEDGNTLFDVENRRLEKEHGWLMNGEVMDAGSGDVDPGTEPEKGQESQERTGEEPDPGLGTAEADTGEEYIEACEAAEVVETETQKTGETVEAAVPAEGETESAAEEGDRALKKRAEEKLEKEKKDAKDRSLAEPVIGYLLERCKEDSGLAQDVVQEHKTWQKCFDYIYSQARKQAKGNCAAVRDEVVYEWAEDYYHKDDRKEEEEKAKKAAEDKAKKVKSAAERKTVRAKNTAGKAEKVPDPSKTEAPKEPPKPKKNGKEMDGQLDMFAMMGM